MIDAKGMRAITENGKCQHVMGEVVYAAANLHVYSCKVGYLSKMEIAELTEAGYTVERDEKWDCFKISW